jgi:hypothetical protein
MSKRNGAIVASGSNRKRLTATNPGAFAKPVTGIIRHHALIGRERVNATLYPSLQKLYHDVETFGTQLMAQSPLNRLQAIIATDTEAKTAMKLVAAELKVIVQEHLRSYLHGLLQEERALAAVAARSYKHANGFTKIVLLQSSWYKVRLHIWWPEVDAAEHIHEHRWWFASTIVSGTMTSETWKEGTSALAREFQEYIYIARDDYMPPRVIPIGHTKLVQEKRTRRRAGNAYTMPPGALHRVVRSEGLTASLVCQASAARGWNRLLTPGDPVQDVAPPFLTPAELSKEITRFLHLGDF